MNLKKLILFLGLLLAAIGMASLPFGQQGIPKHTRDLFVFSPELGLFHSGGISILGLGLVLIFLSALLRQK